MPATISNSPQSSYSSSPLPPDNRTGFPLVQKAVFRCTRRLWRGCCVHRGPRKCIRYRVPLTKTRSAHYEAVSGTRVLFRTTGACFLHRTHIPYHRRVFPRTECAECQKCQGKEASYSTVPRANSPQLQSRDCRGLFIPAAVLPRTDLTIF